LLDLSLGSDARATSNAGGTFQTTIFQVEWDYPKLQFLSENETLKERWQTGRTVGKSTLALRRSDQSNTCCRKRTGDKSPIASGRSCFIYPQNL
jgi:hypothetical protein